MSDVTRILSAIDQGDPSAAEQLLPLVYEELRRLAAQKLSHEKPGQTLQATALVHEAYLRLVDVEQAQHWDREGTSLPLPPRRCGGFWSTVLAARTASRRVATWNVSICGDANLKSPIRSLTTCSRWTKRWTSWL